MPSEVKVLGRRSDQIKRKLSAFEVWVSISRRENENLFCNMNHPIFLRFVTDNSDLKEKLKKQKTNQFAKWTSFFLVWDSTCIVSTFQSEG